jgi:membrane protease YdiL (CAAX protease family)
MRRRPSMRSVHASMLELWQRLQFVVRVAIIGLVISAAGSIPWMLLAGVNLRLWVHAPWAVVPMAFYLWLYWKYLGGAGWPRTTAAIRRTHLRANRLSGEIWGMSLFAGMLGFATLLPLLGIMGRLVRLPTEAQPITTPSNMPFITAFLLVVMASVVAGVVEEAAYRGYVQGPIERRHGLVVAILVNGVLFGLAHYSHHPAAVLAMLPFYVAVSAVYGGLAYATNSILPGLVLHAGGDVFSLTRLWITGRPEWQLSAAPAPLVWETGVDAAFVGSVVAFVLFGAAAAWSYSELARASRPVDARILSARSESQ